MPQLHLEKDPIPKLAGGTRYLKEQLSAYSVRVPLSQECLKDFVLSATDAVVQTQTPAESYISCLCRHLDARARFILLWTTSDETFDRSEWLTLVAIAQKHALPRTSGPASKLLDA